MTDKIWFITGAGRGFGRRFAEAALSRGDRVAATARDVGSLSEMEATFGDALLPIRLDVSDRSAVDGAIEATVDRFGRIDVVVNNAGYGLFGMIEELDEAQLRHQFEVNFFGAFHVTQAVLPILRSQRSGHIVQISTVGGVVTFPGLGGYNASKWALEGLSDALAQEVSGFGIDVTLVEPAGYDTDWAGSSAIHASPIAAYDQLREQIAAGWSSQPAEWYGKPDAVGEAMLELVDSERPPLRVFFGIAPTVMVPQVYAARLAEWKSWEALSHRANG